MIKSDHVIELRFTRAHQALVMLAWSLGLLLAAVVAGACYYHNFLQPAWWWILVPALPALGFGWLAYTHLRHPYLVLTRVGLEIYPFFLPARNMHLVLWQQISQAAVTDAPPLLTLTRADQDDGKIFITLTPLPPRQRALLAKALTGVQTMREKVSEVAE